MDTHLNFTFKQALPSAIKLFQPATKSRVATTHMHIHM